MLRSLVVLLSLAAASASHRVHGNWEHRDDFVAAADEVLVMGGGGSLDIHEVVIAVEQQMLEQLSALTLAVSDPENAAYGKHLTYDQVHTMTANPEATRAVKAWCAAQGAGMVVVSASSHGEYVTVRAPRATWDRVLGSALRKMVHVETGHAVFRSRSFTMPAGLRGHASHVFNVVELPARAGPAQRVNYLEGAVKERALAERALEAAGGAQVGAYPCHSVMKMACFNYRYNMTTNDATGQSQMVFGQKGAYTSPSDLGIFAASNQVPVQTFACPAGGCSNTACEGYDPNMKNKGHLCAEGNLDTQFISGVGQGANNTFYLNTNLDTPFLEFITYISTLAAPPGTVSISYGSYEYEMDHAIMDHFTTEAMKLGAQGVSILSASGDDGVAGYKARNDTAQCKYTTSFPTTCPWVTSVGGAQNAENDPEDHEVHTLKEWAANGIEQQGPYYKITTAGGFSNYFGVPSYQTAAVKGYFATPASKRAAPGYNTTGRGVPDIAGNAINWQVFINAGPALICGTSGSAPSVAGMITAANAQLAKTGKPRLGFLNPLLYKNPGILNDISHGWNNCTAVPAFCCKQGFTGASGWDPLVGLGTPSFTRLLAAAGSA